MNKFLIPSSKELTWNNSIYLETSILPHKQQINLYDIRINKFFVSSILFKFLKELFFKILYLKTGFVSNRQGNKLHDKKCSNTSLNKISSIVW